MSFTRRTSNSVVDQKIYPELDDLPDYGPESGLQQVPVHVKSADGSSTFGLILSIVFAALDIFTDILLALALHAQALAESDDGAARQTRWWFVVTVIIIIVPMVVVNCFSLLWYFQNRKCLGDYCVLHKMSTMRKLYIVVMHTILLGPIARYIDLLLYKYKRSKENRQVMMDEQGALVNRLTPKGEVFAVMQMVIARDSAMLEMLHGFLQDAPQLVFQIFLLYRSPNIIDADLSDTKTVAIQLLKIALALLSLARSLVSYQEELRRGLVDKPSIGVFGVIVCVLWRMCMVAARVIVIGSFSAIVKDSGPKNNNSGWLGYKDIDPSDDPLTYPVITACIFGGHWLVMAVWIHAQKSNFCGRPGDGRPRPCLELLYSVVMGWVHIFCFVNHKETPARGRMGFYYLLNLIENTALIVWWFFKVIVVTELWFRASIVFTVECSFLVGVCCLLLYYGFIHPKAELPEEQHLRFHR
ncbi:XK-related protein 6 [Hyalella azteca]|uniref:XK-related protein n=1 Tax=Hyalella azteca TaxID=294128 RepID=A0A8B7MZA1_HYAAZ|nr:XK-related protein 6 [Hyalella azteca]